MSDNESVVDRLVARWDELREGGQDISPRELCAAESHLGSPQLLLAVESRIEQLKSMDWLDDVAWADSVDRDAVDGPSSADRTPRPALPVTLGGRYELTSLIAEGGFGHVWRAFDRSLERWVAVKVTRIDCRAEARRVARLKHPGIVSVHDVGKENDLCYIVFDLVEGQTLTERIRENRLTWQESATIVAEVAEYVHYAHQKGFIHRDIKPANILLDENGKPVLADFGIAVTQCELERERVTSVGTLAYMSPEQLTPGAALDVRTDIYSLGVVLYELLTGSVPFTDRTMNGLRNKILAGRPEPPRDVDPLLPPAIERICLRCLSVAAQDRYSSADALAGELKKLLNE